MGGSDVVDVWYIALELVTNVKKKKVNYSDILENVVKQKSNSKAKRIRVYTSL